MKRIDNYLPIINTQEIRQNIQQMDSRQGDQIVLNERPSINNYNPFGVIPHGIINAEIEVSVNNLNKQGIELYNKGQYEKAIECYDRALGLAGAHKTNIDRVTLLYNKARAYEKSDNLVLVKYCYNEILKINPNYAKAKEHLEGCGKDIEKKLLRNSILEDIKSEIKIITTSQENDKTKITLLKQVEETFYKPLLKKLAYTKSIEETKKLTEVFNDLGDLTQKIGKLSSELKYYTDAAVFYQYALTMIEEEPEPTLSKNAYEEQTKGLRSKLNEIKGNILAITGGSQIFDVTAETAKNKTFLSCLRIITDKSIKLIESNRQKNNEDLYINNVRDLFKNIAKDMKKFLADLYKSSEKEIGPAPCKYTVIGLGSMALQQMTPYSDLEFAILTENDEYKENPKTKDYFKNLSHLVNFKIINLGETTIPSSKYNINFDHLVHVGVNLDLGGKTPLGRIEGDKPYELIQTVDGMLWYMRNEYNKASHIDKNLPYILEKVCHVCGDKLLMEEHQKQVKHFLFKEKDDNGNLNCETRALKVLKEGAVEFNYLKIPNKPETLQLKGNIEAFKPTLSEKAGELFNVKQEIYRLPDRLIYSWGLYYGIEGDSAWDIVDQLKNKGFIEVEAVNNLKYAVTFATTLRLNTYLHNKGQREDMSIFPNEKIFHLPKNDLGEDGDLFKYFYTTLPLYERLKEFCDYKFLDDESKKEFFREYKFYMNDFANKGFVYHRLAQYKNAQRNLEYAVKDLEKLSNLDLARLDKLLYARISLGDIYNDFGFGEKAIEQYYICLNKYNIIHQNKPNRSTAIVLQRLGTAFLTLENCKEAEQRYIESLNMLEKLPEDKETKAILLNCLGNTCSTCREYDKAIIHYTNSRMYYNDEHCLGVAVSLANMGIIYCDMCKYDDTLKYLEQSLSICESFYKYAPHKDVADSLDRLGKIYIEIGNYDEAIKRCKQSLDIYELIYNKESHPFIATILSHLGVLYKEKGERKEAIEYFTRSLNIQEIVYKKSHSDVAGTLNNLGELYREIGNYNEAIKHHTRSLNMLKDIYEYNDNEGSSYHPDIARSFNNLGIVYNCKEQYGDAFDNYEKSLKIYDNCYKDGHTDTVSVLNNLGALCSDLGQYQKAIKYYEQSRNMQQSIHNGPHSGAASIICNLGVVYFYNKEYEKAIKYYEESLDMRIKVYKDKPHSDIIESLDNLVLVYQHTGNFKKVAEYNTLRYKYLP